MFSFEFPKSCSIPFNGRRASVKYIKDVPEEVADITYRGISEVHLFLCAPSLENCPLGRIDGLS